MYIGAFEVQVDCRFDRQVQAITNKGSKENTMKQGISDSGKQNRDIPLVSLPRPPLPFILASQLNTYNYNPGP